MDNSCAKFIFFILVTQVEVVEWLQPYATERHCNFCLAINFDDICRSNGLSNSALKAEFEAKIK